MHIRVPGNVTVLPDPSPALLIGKTIVDVKWARYRPVTLICDDGSAVELRASGQPPTIFATEVPR